MPDPIQTNDSTPAVARPDRQPTAPAQDILPTKPDGRISLVCPVGITPYAAEGLGSRQPLFARVSYLPE